MTDPLHSRSGASLRALLTLMLVAGLLVIVLVGMLTDKDAEEVTQYAAPISGLAGIAVGYWFGTEQRSSS